MSLLDLIKSCALFVAKAAIAYVMLLVACLVLWAGLACLVCFVTWSISVIPDLVPGKESFTVFLRVLALPSLLLAMVANDI